MKSDNFFAELQRRNVYKVAVAYAVGAWLLIQIATQVFPFFDFPNWVVRLVVLLTIVGFPVAVVCSWAFELTPEGIKREGEVERSRSITRRTGRRLTALIVVVAALAAGVTVFRFLHLERDARPEKQAPLAAEIDSKSIAVLPFENLSSNKENAFFADGVQDEILTNLARIADLKVISRTSMMQYKTDAPRNMREIAQQLSVAHLLEGSVQRVANRVRVNAQLIDARTDAHLWAQTYDRDLADVFAIQSEIAKAIADQLKAALSPKEQAAIQAKPTLNLAAYDLYLRAREIGRSSALEATEGEWIQKQVTLLEGAVTRDPAFVPALCHLAFAHLEAYWWNHDHTPKRLELARTAIEAAARLQPDAGEVHRARAQFYYWGHRDYAPALAELALARRSLPNDADVLVFLGAVARRKGQWEQSIRTTEDAVVLDPRNPRIAGELARAYHALRRYAEERRILKNSLTWKPEEFSFHVDQASIDLSANADPRALRNVAFGEVAKKAEPDEAADVQLSVALAERDYHAAEQALSAYHQPHFSSEGFFTPREYQDGRIARGLGDTNRAKAAFSVARNRAAEAVNARPQDAKAVMVLALIDAALGRKDEAAREGERAVDLLPVTSDAVDGATLVGRLATVYAEMGDTDRAVAHLEKAVALPHSLHYGDLKLDERFDSIRKDPRFEKILMSLAPKR